ncbi:hypothetical protein GCM10029978_059550 [Actinoallomurus acanthiterrae]
MIENEEATPTHHAPQVRVVTASSCTAAVPTQPAAARTGVAAEEPGSRRGWASVGAVALGAFVIVMTETLPVGLLPQIADGLHVSLGLAGLMVLVPGFSAAVSAPPFFLCSGRFNRRSVILVLCLTVLVSNAVVAVAPNFLLVLIARMLFGAALGAFWTVVAPVGPKLVGPAGGTRAITIIAAGISGGTVVGLPAGQFLGNLVGWRPTFAIAAAATLLIVVVQTVVLPGIPPDGRTHLRDLVGVVTRRAARLASVGTLPWLAGLLIALWGLVWGIVNPGTLVWMLDSAPETPEAASAVNVTNLQIALAAGSGLGAILVSSTTLQTVFLTAGFTVLASAVLTAVAARFITLTRRE